MAKKRKLNKRAVAVLIALGAVVLLAVAVGTTKWWLPRDPTKYAAKAEDAWNAAEKAHSAGNEEAADRHYEEADRCYGIAVGLRPDDANYLFKLAQVKQKLVLSRRYADTERRAMRFRAVELLRKAVRLAPGYADPQRVLCDIYWGYAPLIGYKEFLVEVDRLIQIEPNDHEAWFRRAVAKARESVAERLPDEDRVGEALADFRQSLELKPDELEYWRALLDYLTRVGRDANVPETYEQAIAANPSSVPLRVEYAGYLRRHDRSAEARRLIEDAIRTDANDILGYIALSEHCEAADRDVEAAQKALAEAIRIDDSDPRIYQQMADLLLRQNKPKEATEAIRQGIQTAADRLSKETNDSEVRRLQWVSGQMYANLAQLLLTRHMLQPQDASGALEEVEKCLEAMGDRRGRARITGLLAFARGDLRGCVPPLQQAMREGAADFQVTNALVTAFLRLEQPTLAQKVLEEVSRQPGLRFSPDLHLMMAELKMVARDYRGADLEIAKVLQASQAASPAQARAREMKFVLMVLSGDRAVLPAGVNLSPTAVSLLMDRAMQLLSERKGREAMVLLENLHKIVPANRQVIAWLLNLYLSSDRQDLADALKTEAERTDPSLASWIGEEIDLRKEEDPRKRYKLQADRLERESGDLRPAEKELQLAQIAMQVGLAEEANTHMYAAARLDSNNPRVVERFFLNSIARQDVAAAEEWAGRAAAANMDGMDGRWYAVRLAVVRQDIPKAKEDLIEILRLRPDFKLGRVMLADCYRVSNEPEKALELYDAVYKVDSTFYPAVKGLAVVTAQLRRQTEHELWVERASRLPQGRDDPYIQAQSVSFMERKADPNTLPMLIEKRSRLLQQDPSDLDNAYMLGILFEQAKRLAESQRRPDEVIAALGTQAERTFRYIYENAHPRRKLDAAKPLAEFYARNEKIGALTGLLAELWALEGADRVSLHILQGDAYAYFDPNRAEWSYQEAVKLAPANSRVQFVLARFYQRQQNWPQAVKAFERYQELAPPNDRSAALWTANAQMHVRDYAGASRNVAAALANDPLNPDALALAGVLAMRDGRPQDAEKSFDQALQSDASHLEALLGKTRLRLAQGRPEEARRILQSVRVVTDDPGVTMGYAQVCLYLGDLTAAEMAFREVLSRQKDYPPAVLGLIDLYLTQQNWPLLEQRLREAKAAFPSDVGYLLIESRMWKLRKEPGKSLDAMRAAVAASGDSSPVRIEYALRLLEEQQYRKAFDESNDCVSKPPLRLAALAAKGQAMVRLGLPGAEAAFEAAMKAGRSLDDVMFIANRISPAYASPKAACEATARWIQDANGADPHSRALLGLLYSEAGDHALAARCFAEARAAAAPGEKTGIGILLGVAHQRNKDSPQAERAYLEVLRDAPGDVRALNNLAYLYAEDMKDPNRALPYARRALELAVGNPDVVDTYGWVLVQLKRYTEAIEQLRRAVAIGGQKAVYKYHLGYALEQDGRPEEALRSYSEGLSLPAPDDETISALLQQGADRIRGKLRPE